MTRKEDRCKHIRDSMAMLSKVELSPSYIFKGFGGACASHHKAPTCWEMVSESRKQIVCKMVMGGRCMHLQCTM